MITLFLFIFASIGLTNIVVRESIFSKLRSWIDKVFPYSMIRKIINCETCFGFYAGIFLALIFPSFEINWFLAGLISSIANKTYVLMFLKFKI